MVWLLIRGALRAVGLTFLILVVGGMFISPGPVQAGERPFFRLETGGHNAMVRAIFFTANGQNLVSAGDDKTIRLWDVSSGRLLRTLRGQCGPGPEGMIYAAAISPDERLLAVGGWLGPGQDYREKDLGRIRIHDLNTGEVLALLPGHQDVVLSLAFSPDGKYLASGGFDHGVRLWRVEDWQAGPRELSGHRADVYGLAFSPDSKYLVSAGDDGNLYVWRTVDGSLVHCLAGHTGQVRAVAWSRDGAHIFSGASDRIIKMWETRTWTWVKDLAVLDKHPRNFALSRDGSKLLVGTARFVGPYQCPILAIPEGNIISKFDSHQSTIVATAFSPDGELVAMGSGLNHQIFLWHSASGELSKTLAGSGHRVWKVGIAENGLEIAWGVNGDSSTITGRVRLEKSLVLPTRLNGPPARVKPLSAVARFNVAVHRVGYCQLRASPGGNFGYDDAVLDIVKAGRVTASLVRDGTNGYRHRAFTLTPDGKMVITGGDLGVLAAYDTATGRKIRDFFGHEGEVLTLAVSKNGRVLVSGGTDQTIKLWDLTRSVQAAEPLLSIFVDSEDQWLIWTPQGYYHGWPGAERYAGWQVNHGQDRAADFYDTAYLSERKSSRVLTELVRSIVWGRNRVP